MNNQWIRFLLVSVVVACFGSVCQAQCDGLVHAGALYGEGAFGSNLATNKSLLLPENTKLDSTYHQQTLGAVENGKSDAHSHLKVTDIPAGICIVASGDNSANHGWAVGDGPDPIKLEPVKWNATTNVITQFSFEMRLYCTTGSGVIDRTTGGCNAKVEVYYKPLAAAKAKTTPQKAN